MLFLLIRKVHAYFGSSQFRALLILTSLMMITQVKGMATDHVVIDSVVHVIQDTNYSESTIIEFKPGGEMYIDDGVTVSIEHLLAPPMKIFDGPGNVQLGNLTPIGHPEWFGWSTNASANENTKAFHSLKQALRTYASIQLGLGEYKISQLILDKNMNLSGTSMYGTRLRVYGRNYGIIVGNVQMPSRQTDAERYERGVHISNLEITCSESCQSLGGIRLGGNVGLDMDVPDTIDRAEYRLAINTSLENLSITNFNNESVVHPLTVAGSDKADLVSGGSGVFIGTSISSKMENVKCMGNVYGLVEAAAGDATTWHIVSSQFKRNIKYGIYLQSLKSSIFSGVLAESNGGPGVYVKIPDELPSNTSSIDFYNLHLEANNIGFGDYGIEIFWASNEELGNRYPLDYRFFGGIFNVNIARQCCAFYCQGCRNLLIINPSLTGHADSIQIRTEKTVSARIIGVDSNYDNLMLDNATEEYPSLDLEHETMHDVATYSY